MDDGVELWIEPGSARFASDDDPWIDQVSALVKELREAAGNVSTRRAPVRGGKGAAESIALSLASSAGVSSLIQLIRSWLTRDRTRSLKVSWSGSGVLENVELSGEDLPDNVLEELATAIKHQLADRP
jgi:hypothetical protein